MITKDFLIRIGFQRMHDYQWRVLLNLINEFQILASCSDVYCLMDDPENHMTIIFTEECPLVVIGTLDGPVDETECFCIDDNQTEVMECILNWTNYGKDYLKDLVFLPPLSSPNDVYRFLSN